MKQLFILVFTLCFVGGTFAQRTKSVRTIEKFKTVNFKEASEQSDPMPFMTNVHAHPIPPKIEHEKSTRTDNMPTRRELGTAPQPTTTATISPGPNHDGGYPYDNGIAVSATGQVITVTNMGVYIYDLEEELAYSAGYHAFIGLPGGKFDPQVIYDSHHNRFAVICLQTGVAENCGVFIAVSTEDDPTGDWNVFRIANDHTDPASWVDFPHLGISNERLYVHANILNGGNFLESDIWDLPLDDLFAGGNLLVTQHITPDSNIKFVQGGESTNYGNILYGINTAITNAVYIYEFYDGNMVGPHAVSTNIREGGASFDPHGKVLYPGGDANNSYSYFKDNKIYYAQAGVIQSEDADTAVLLFGRIDLNTDDLILSSAAPVCYIKDGEREYTYAQVAYAGYTGENGIAASLITALYGAPDEYLGTICYHVDPEENVSNPLIAAEGQGHVSTRFGDYIQSVYDPSGTREVWISGQFGSSSETDAIEDMNDPDIYLGNIIAKIQVPLPTDNQQAEIKETKHFVFPNPATEFFTTQFTVERTGIYYAKLYAANGQEATELFSRRLRKGPASFTFNTLAFNPGVYIVVITDEYGDELIKSPVIVK